MDRDSLLARLDAFKPGPAPCADPTIPGSGDLSVSEMKRHESDGYNDIAARREAYTGEYEFNVMADHLAGIPGRKNLIWITSQFRLSPAKVKRLSDANVAIYPVDVIGSIIATPRAKKARYDPLRAFAAMTGGVAFYDRDDVAASISKSNAIEELIQTAADDGELTYTLGFYPTEEGKNAALPDKSWYDLRVAVNRRGVSLRYRGNYLASGVVTAANEASTRDVLLNDPFDATQLELFAETTTDHVQVTVDLHDVHLEKLNDTWTGAIDVTLLVEGTHTARTVTRKLEIPDAELPAALAKGIVVNDSIAANGQPGVLRIVAQDRATGAAGSLRIRLNRQ